MPTLLFVKHTVAAYEGQQMREPTEHGPCSVRCQGALHNMYKFCEVQNCLQLCLTLARKNGATPHSGISGQGALFVKRFH